MVVKEKPSKELQRLKASQRKNRERQREEQESADRERLEQREALRTGKPNIKLTEPPSNCWNGTAFQNYNYFVQYHSQWGPPVLAGEVDSYGYAEGGKTTLFATGAAVSVQGSVALATYFHPEGSCDQNKIHKNMLRYWGVRLDEARDAFDVYRDRVLDNDNAYSAAASVLAELKELKAEVLHCKRKLAEVEATLEEGQRPTPVRKRSPQVDRELAKQKAAFRAKVKSIEV